MATCFTKFGTKLALLLLIALAVSACGRRGNLEAPPSAVSQNIDGSVEEQPQPEKPDTPFILDPLL